MRKFGLVAGVLLTGAVLPLTAQSQSFNIGVKPSEMKFVPLDMSRAIKPPNLNTNFYRGPGANAPMNLLSFLPGYSFSSMLTPQHGRMPVKSVPFDPMPNVIPAAWDYLQKNRPK